MDMAACLQPWWPCMHRHVHVTTQHVRFNHFMHDRKQACAYMPCMLVLHGMHATCTLAALSWW